MAPTTLTTMYRIVPARTGVHVVPAWEEWAHDLCNECPCGPSVEYTAADGKLYENGPFVMHDPLPNRAPRI